MTKHTTNATHPAIVKRLKRANRTFMTFAANDGNEPKLQSRCQVVKGR